MSALIADDERVGEDEGGEGVEGCDYGVRG